MPKENEVKNKLILGDNLDILKTLKDESIDLIYIDPPFFSNRNYEVIFGDEAEIRSFEDRWEGGVNVYVEWMKERVTELYRVLKPTGSFYLHCAWHASHHLRVMLDEVFGAKHFQNEIIWAYRTGGATQKRWSRKHDNIYFYTKTDNYTFNSQKEKSYMVEGSGENPKQTYYEDKGGRYTLVNAKDWWEIGMMATSSKERLGYPTQKPEALLEKIIKASSNKDDIVLDSFCGCGTSVAVAQKLNRHWIGIDISPTAIKLVERRLNTLGARKDTYITINTPTTDDDLRAFKPFEFQNWVIDELQAKHSKQNVGDMGLDGYFEKDLWHDEAGVQVKQSDGVGRNVVDNFETALKRGGYKKGYIVAFSFSKGAFEEVARVKKDDLDIKLIKVSELLDKKKPIL
ncbi:MAG: DNA methyltransferase [Patescibacteria group bacterium]